MFHPEQEPLTILPEEPIYADTKQECFEEVKTTIPFYCVVNIPHGFEYVPNGTHKIAYNLDCLSVIEEQCRKTIQVEGGGPCFVQAAIGSYAYLVDIKCYNYTQIKKVGIHDGKIH